MPEFVIDPATGQRITLPDALGSYMGLPRYEPPTEIGADPTAWGSSGVEQYDPNAQPTIPQTVMESAEFAAEKQRRLALPEAVRNGTYAMDDNAAGAPQSPTIAQRTAAPGGASSMGPRAFITQATGPMGTIGQIGDDLVVGSAPRGEYATQADLDAFTREQAAAIPPPAATPSDPNRPEEAGADLQRQANAMQETAVGINTDADQRQANAEVNALEDEQKRVNALREETAKENARRQKRYEELSAQKTAKVDAWADYKIDQGRRWKNASTGQKIAAAIAVGMSALGDALQRKSGPNMALGIITQAIEDDVNLQVQERQHLGEIASKARTSLDDYRAETAEWREAQQLKLAEEYKRTAKQIELQAAHLKSDRAKASGLSMVAALREKAAAFEQGVAGAAWNREMKLAEFAEQKRHAKAQEGLAWANHKQNASQFDETMKFKREELAAQQKATVDTYLAKATAEQAKDLRESGIKDPTTGQYIVADGKPVMSRNVAEAAKVQETVDGTQTLLSTVDRIKAKIANDPGFAKLNATQKQAALSAEMDSLTILLKDAYTMGTLDKGLLEFTNSWTGGDPSKLTAKGLFGAFGLGADAGEKTVAKLDVIAQTAESRALNRMGNPKGFKFARDEKVQESTVNKAAEDLRRGTPTTAKAVEDTKPGWLAKPLQDTEAWLFGTTQQYKKDEDAAREGAGNSLRYPGFRVEKEPQIDTLVSHVKAGDKQAQKRLLELVGDSKTPGLQDAAMTIVETWAPELYAKALAELPNDKRAQRIAADAARAKGPSIKLYQNGGVTPPTTPRSTNPLIPQSAIDAARRSSDPLKTYLEEGD